VIAEQALDSLGALVGLDAGWVIRTATPGIERLIARPRESALERPLREFLVPHTADATIEALAQAVQASHPMVVAATLEGNRPVLLVPVPTRAPSAEIYVLVTDLLRARGIRSAPPGTPVDLAQRHEDSAAVYRARLTDVEAELGEAALLFEVSDDIATSLDRRVVLTRVVEHATRLCRAHTVAAELLDPDTGLLAVGAVSGDPAGQLSGFPVRPDGTLAGRAIAEGGPVTATGRESEPLYARYSLEGERRRLLTSMAVPLIAGSTVVGALVFSRRGAQFDAAEVQRAERFARRVAIAIRNARVYSKLSRELEELREAQAQLVQTEKLSAVGRLAAGTAHEINNPLAAIVGNAELLLRRERLTPTQGERVDRILHAAYRAARIVKELLAFVRAQPPELGPTDVTRLLRDAVAERADDLALDRIQLVEQLTQLPVIQGDAQQLGQVFGNILDNALDAVKATPEGQGRLIRLASWTGTDHLQIRIENSGSPIGEAVLSRIFDPFFTTKDVGRGAGLGLSVCQGIVTAHGGRIWAENGAHGVAFVIELPSGERSASAPDAPISTD
jgi:signal transduction histidine kinase